MTKRDFSFVERMKLPGHLNVRDDDRELRVQIMQLFDHYKTNQIVVVLRNVLREKHEEVFED